MVKWLAEQGCNLDQLDDFNGNALPLAAQGGYLEVVKWLAEQGFDIHHIDKARDNALTLAAKEGHLEVV